MLSPSSSILLVYMCGSDTDPKDFYISSLFLTLDDEVAVLNDRMPVFPPERPSQQEGGLASGEGDTAATD